MPSQARQRYNANDTEVERLLAIHGMITQGVQGRHHNTGALHKSSLIMMCACWEAYIEDLIREATAHMLAIIDDPARLPDGMRWKIAEDVRGEKDPMGAWRLSGNGWKHLVTARVEQLYDGLNGGLNTPNSKNVSDLPRTTLGVNVTTSWSWRRMANETAKAKLNRLVKARGSVAHGQPVDGGLNIATCNGFRNHVARLVELTDEAVNRHMEATYGRPLFEAAPQAAVAPPEPQPAQAAGADVAAPQGAAGPGAPQ